MPGNTKDAILDAAKMLFTQKGYDATSVDLIAKEVGFTKAALYYHFTSKEDILVELMNRTAENAIYYIGGPEFHQLDVEDGEKLKSYLHKLFDFLIQEKDVLTIALVEFLKANQEHRSLLLNIRTQVFSRFKNVISFDKYDEAAILFALCTFVLFEALKDKITDESNIKEETFENGLIDHMIAALTTLILKNTGNPL